LTVDVGVEGVEGVDGVDGVDDVSINALYNNNWILLRHASSNFLNADNDGCECDCVCDVERIGIVGLSFVLNIVELDLSSLSFLL
jgi:hypothetical protein